jgi:hypothetical protein
MAATEKVRVYMRRWYARRACQARSKVEPFLTVCSNSALNIESTPKNANSTLRRSIEPLPTGQAGASVAWFQRSPVQARGKVEVSQLFGVDSTLNFQL